MGISGELPLWKLQCKIGPFWSVRCLKYLDPWKGQWNILTSTNSDGLRNNFMNSLRNTCCYNWKQLPSGLLWSFSLRWKSTYTSAWSRCYHGNHSAKWKPWKMLITRMYVVLKLWVVKHVFITGLVSLEVEYCPWRVVRCFLSLSFLKQKVCDKSISFFFFFNYIFILFIYF